jgi:hypothetical protein
MENPVIIQRSIAAAGRKLPNKAAAGGQLTSEAAAEG